MSTKNARARKPFIRTVSMRNGDGIKAIHLRAPIESSQSILATGRHHMSSWLGTRELVGEFETTDSGFLTKITPGPNAAFLTVSLMVQQVSASATLQIADDSENLRTIPPGVESSSSLSNIQEMLYQFAVSPGVETDIYFVTNGDYLVKCITVYDTPLQYMESGDDGYVDLSSYYKGKEIAAATIQGIVGCQEKILSDLRKVHLNIASYIDDEPLETVTPTSNVMNYFDLSMSGYNQASAPGFWVRPGACYNGDGKTRVNCRVKAISSSGTGVLKFIASSSAATSNILVSTTLDWVSATLDLVTPNIFQAQYADKVELHCQDATVSSTLDIYAIVIEEMDGVA